MSAGNARTDELTLGELFGVLAAARRLGAEHVKLTGGEPFTRRDSTDLIMHAIELGFRVSVETNGMHIPGPLAKRLGDLRDSLTLYVSLDGSYAAMHDRLRGLPGAFDRTMSTLDLLSKAGARFCVHTVVRRESLDDVAQICKLVAERRALQHKLVLSIHSLGRGRLLQEAALTLHEIFYLLATLPPTEFWDYGWHPQESGSTALMTTLPPAFQPRGKAVQTCGWGKSFLAVLANGDVALCHGLYDVEPAIVGNLRRAPLEAIWSDSQVLGASREWDEAGLLGVCGNCAVADDCRGLCRASAVSFYGDMRSPYPFCQAAYDQGLFPSSMLIDSRRDCSFTIANTPGVSGAPVALSTEPRC